MTGAELVANFNVLNSKAATIKNNTTGFITQQAMLKHTKETLLGKAREYDNSIKDMSTILVDNKEAMGLLNTVKDMNTAQSYAFIEHNLNIALEKVFRDSIRKIRLVEGTYNSKYPELRLELITENNVKRNLKTDSGHGIRQVVSLLTTLCLICVSGARRFLVLDEVLTGLSLESRQAVDDILWAFTEIGFQFVVVEHGFTAKNSHVYQLKLENGISHLEKEYITSKPSYELEDLSTNIGE